MGEGLEERSSHAYRVARELYEAASAALSEGRVAVAAVLAAGALEALGLDEGRARALREATVGGVVPSEEAVAEALEAVRSVLESSGGKGGRGGRGYSWLLAGGGVATLALALALDASGLAAFLAGALGVLALLAATDIALHGCRTGREIFE